MIDMQRHLGSHVGVATGTERYDLRTGAQRCRAPDLA